MAKEMEILDANPSLVRGEWMAEEMIVGELNNCSA